MYQDNNEENTARFDSAGGDAGNIPNVEPPQNETYYSESSYSEPPQSEPMQSMPPQVEPIYGEQPQNVQVYSEQPQSTPVYNEPVYHVEPTYSEQAYNEPTYSEPTYSEPTYSSPVYSEPVYSQQPYINAHEPQGNMYSPGICVSQPYPRTRTNENGRNGASRERSGNGLVGFLRAMALVLVCAVFSGVTAYVVTDHRFNSGDFAPPNHVVLGSGLPERRSDDNATLPVGNMVDGMSAQDIYDMARTQVVVIHAEVPSIPNMFGVSDSSPASGSGFIISSDGYILTNYHVIEIAHVNDLPITVVLGDGTSHVAEVVGFEPHNDVAVIKINLLGLNPVFIGDSDNMRVGETIYAIGNPFGDLVYTMTDGIVSALDRVVSVEGASIGTFQFSAAVNAGNSGGPIFNTNGEVLGIVTAKVVRGNVEGIGFAIPINDAIEIATELIEHGYISGRPLLGITGQAVTPANAEYMDMAVGILIRGINPDSAADKAGLKVGDIITAIDDAEIDSMEILRFVLRGYRAGDSATVTVWRQGEVMDLTIIFDEDLYAGRTEQRPIIEPESPDPFEDMP